MFYLFHVFRSFLPLQNPIGFGASDFIDLALAALLVAVAVFWQRLGPGVGRFASRTAWCMLLLAALPVVLRLILLRGYPVPNPLGSDDYSYLLLGDTLSHFRLTNPTHPMHRFFETLFVLQQPSYSSIYPLGQGLTLAFGQLIFRQPWAGVVLSVAATSSLCYWMLRAWVAPEWALAGGVLAAIQFGPLSQWMNSYWGGSTAAAAGCLVFGSLARLAQRASVRNAALLGVGLSAHLLTRPFESVFLALVVLLFMAPWLREPDKLRQVARVSWAVALPVVLAVGLIALHDRSVTGSWTTLPYALSRYQYGVPTAFTIQANPVPHNELTPEQKVTYEIQSSVHGDQTDTPASYFERLVSRVRFYRFFLLPPLYIAVAASLVSLRESRFRWVCLTILIFALGTNIYPYFFSHYIAAITCLIVLVSVKGLDNLNRLSIFGHPAGADAARLILFLCGVHFLFWYGLHLSSDPDAWKEIVRYESWDAINHGDPDGRLAVQAQLAQAPGNLLVFVRYWPPHTFVEWVYNGADIDRARIVWARDRGLEENEELRRYYPDREAWLLEPDTHPPRLRQYQATLEPPRITPTSLPPQPPVPQSKPVAPERPQLKLEQVR